MSELENLQRRFLSLVREPSGVKPGLATLSEKDPGIAPLSNWIVGPDEDLAIRRLDVYANMYFFRLLDILKGDYPKVLATLKDAAFHNLVTDYLWAHPSRDPSVRNIGQFLPAFLRHHPLTKDRPWLAEVAELEWGWTCVFDAADDEVLTEAHLAALPPEAWVDLEIRTISAFRVFDVSYPVHELVQRIQAGEDVKSLEPRKCSILLYRRGFEVRYREAHRGEREILDLAQKGVSFPRICEYLSGPEEDDVMAVAQRAQSLLRNWLDDGILCAQGAKQPASV